MATRGQLQGSRRTIEELLARRLKELDDAHSSQDRAAIARAESAVSACRQVLAMIDQEEATLSD